MRRIARCKKKNKLIADTKDLGIYCSRHRPRIPRNKNRFIADIREMKPVLARRQPNHAVVTRFWPFALVKHVDFTLDFLHARSDDANETLARQSSNVHIRDPFPMNEVFALGDSRMPHLARIPRLHPRDGRRRGGTDRIIHKITSVLPDDRRIFRKGNPAAGRIAISHCRRLQCDDLASHGRHRRKRDSHQRQETKNHRSTTCRTHPEPHAAHSSFPCRSNGFEKSRASIRGSKKAGDAPVIWQSESPKRRS